MVVVVELDLRELEEEDDDDDEDDDDIEWPPSPLDDSRTELVSEWNCSSFEWPPLTGGGNATILAVTIGAEW